MAAVDVAGTANGVKSFKSSKVILLSLWIISIISNSFRNSFAVTNSLVVWFCCCGGDSLAIFAVVIDLFDAGDSCAWWLLVLVLISGWLSFNWSTFWRLKQKQK